jgi:hypothetical protein
MVPRQRIGDRASFRGGVSTLFPGFQRERVRGSNAGAIIAALQFAAAGNLLSGKMQCEQLKAVGAFHAFRQTTLDSIAVKSSARRIVPRSPARHIPC